MKPKINFILFFILIAPVVFGQDESFLLKENSLKEELAVNTIPYKMISSKSELFGTEETLFIKDSSVSYSYNSDTDSILSDKSIFTHDVHGNYSLIIEYKWDTDNNNWINNWKYNYSYNTNETNTIIYRWYPVSNAWSGYRNYSNYYDVNGNNTAYIFYVWNSDSNDWVKSYWNEYGYDSYSNKILWKQYQWDLINSLWLNSKKTEFTYDVSGKNTSEIRTLWDSDSIDWIYEYKVVNSNEVNQTISIGYNWYADSNDWINHMKYIYSYDDRGNLALKLRTIWDSDSNDWVNHSKEENSYDESNNKILYVSYDWDSDSNNWVGDTKNEYSYDANGNKLSHTYYLWYSNTWAEGYKYEYHYDANSNQTLVIYNNSLTKQKTFYYYSEITNIVNSNEDSDVSIYPNPATDYLTINSVKGFTEITLELFDLQGRNVLHKEFANCNTISLKGLTPGLYLYVLKIDGERFSGKLMKE